LDEMEMIDDQSGLRQRPADRGLEDRAHVDRNEPHRVAPRLTAFGQPVDDHGGVAALDLP
jgi:hypothetical protein